MSHQTDAYDTRLRLDEARAVRDLVAAETHQNHNAVLVIERRIQRLQQVFNAQSTAALANQPDDGA